MKTTEKEEILDTAVDDLTIRLVDYNLEDSNILEHGSCRSVDVAVDVDYSSHCLPMTLCNAQMSGF